MKKIVSVCWFRTNSPKNRTCEYYTGHWPTLIKTFKLVYPEYELYWWYDPSFNDQPYSKVLFEIAKQVDWFKLIPFKTSYLATGQMQRQAPIWTTNADYVFCNDVDVAFTPRARTCREEFIKSGLDVHVIRDCKWHDKQILTGLIGFRTEPIRAKIPSFENYISRHESKDEFEYNQWYTKFEIWDRFKSMAHNAPEAGPDPTECFSVPLPKESKVPELNPYIIRVLDASVLYAGGGSDDVPLFLKVLNQFDHPWINFVNKIEKDVLCN